MSTIASLNVLLGMQTGGFSKGVKKATGETNTFAKGINSIGAGLGGIFGLALNPIVATVGGIYSVSKAMGAAEESAQAGAKLESVIAATGGAAGLSVGEIQALSSELQDLTNFEDDATNSAAAVLLTFKEIKGDVFKDAIRSAQDMSAVLGTGLQGSVLQIGKALNDPTKGISALSKAGVSFTQQQKDQIKTLQKSGDIVGAQAIILRELQGEFGGAAQAMANPFTQFQNKAGDVMEAVGGYFLPIRDGIIALANDALEWVGGALTAGKPYWDAFLTTAVNTFWGIVEFATPIFNAWVGYFSAAVTMAVEVGQAAWSMLSEAFVGIANTAAEMFGFASGDALSFSDVMGTISEYIQASFMVLEFGFTHWRDVGSYALLKVALGFVSFGNTVAYYFTEVIPAYFMWFGGVLADVFDSALGSLLAFTSNVAINIQNLWSAITSFLSGDGFNFEWTALTDGVGMSIRALPEIAAREIGAIEGDLQTMVNDLGAQIGEDFASFTANRAVENIAKNSASSAAIADYRKGLGGLKKPNLPNTTGPTENLIANGDGKKKGAETQLGALVRGSAEAYKAAHGGDNPMKDLNKIAKDQLEVSKGIRDAVEKDDDIEEVELS